MFELPRIEGTHRVLGTSHVPQCRGTFQLCPRLHLLPGLSVICHLTDGLLLQTGKEEVQENRSTLNGTGERYKSINSCTKVQ